MTGEDNYKSIESGYKRERVNKADGYTIVFISTANNKKYLNDEIDNIDIEGAGKIKKLITYPAEPELKKSVKHAIDEINYMGAKLKIIDFDNPAPEDKQYLAKNHIKIPKDPDIFVRYGDKAQLDAAGSGGFADYPGFGNYVTIAKGYAEYSTYHEIGHALGLKHPFAKNTPNKTTLAKDLDNRGQTSMSYTNDEGDHHDYRKLDALALRDMYGAAKGYGGAFERYVDANMGFPSIVYKSNGFAQEVYGDPFNDSKVDLKFVPPANVKIKEIDLDRKTTTYTDANGQEKVFSIESFPAKINYYLPVEGNIVSSNPDGQDIGFDLDAAKENAICQVNICGEADISIKGSGSGSNAKININYSGKDEQDLKIHAYDVNPENISLNLNGAGKLSVSLGRRSAFIDQGNGTASLANDAVQKDPALLLDIIKINSVPLSKLGYTLTQDKYGRPVIGGKTEQPAMAAVQANTHKVETAHPEPHTSKDEDLKAVRAMFSGKSKDGGLVEEVLNKISKQINVSNPIKLRSSLNNKLKELEKEAPPGADLEELKNMYLKNISKQLDKGKLPDFLDGKKMGFNSEQINSETHDIAAITKKTTGWDLGT